MLVIPAGNTASAQVKGAPQRPERCPLCEVIGQNALRSGASVIGNGYYPRKPLDLTGDLLQLIRIHRWLCRACGKTTSMLPDYLSPLPAVHLGRHRRGVDSAVWAGPDLGQIQAELSQCRPDAAPAPSVDSLRRWCQAYRRLCSGAG